MTMTLRVIVADDERPARQFLVTMLRSFEDVDIVGEAQTGTEAIRLIEQTQPDLALLDLQMPEMDGLSIVRSLRHGRIPLVAFVTAFDEHAVSAFEIEALDYLLKPVDRGRLRTTINRAHERLERAALAEQERDGQPAPADRVFPAQAGQYIDRFPIRKQDDIYFVTRSPYCFGGLGGRVAARDDAWQRTLYDELSFENVGGQAGPQAVSSSRSRGLGQRRCDQKDHSHAGRLLSRDVDEYPTTTSKPQSIASTSWPSPASVTRFLPPSPRGRGLG